MSDLTLLYYTANRISGFFSGRVRAHLESLAQGRPIVSVSQAPIDFGHNVCVGPIGISFYNVCRQVLIGCLIAQTEYIACCEDDTLYTLEHFEHRPPENTFAYDKHWTLGQDGQFWFRNRTGLLGCIAPRRLMIEALQERFAKFPYALPPEQLVNWGEPGRERCDTALGLMHRAVEYFQTVDPIVTFNHRPSLGGVRKNNALDTFCTDLPTWGNGKRLLEVFRD